MTTPAVAAHNPDITVWVNGARLPDGCLVAPDDSPVALTGLSVAWGRDTTIDQPSPSTCTLEVLDQPGGERFRDRLMIGARLDVRATAQLYLAPTTETLALPLAFSTDNAKVTAGASRDVTVVPSPSSTRASLITFYPLPISSNPTAWDTVPRTAAGQSWAYRIDPTVPGFAGWAAGAVTLEWLAFSAPTGKVMASGSIPTGSGTFVPPAGAWIGLRVRWWPSNPAWDDLDATTWDALDTRTWDELVVLTLANVSVLAPPVGAVREAMVFSGRITDMVASYDLDMAGTLVKITAQDNTADLANRGVGDQPWVAETLITRWNRIIAAAGQATASSVATSAQPVQVTWRDVDNQPATQLLAELAQSVDGVLWSATHVTTGPVLVLETMADRPALMRLEMGTDGLVHIVPGTDFAAGGRGIHLDACAVDLEPVEWAQDISDVATRVAVQWKEQTLNDKGQPAPTDRTETVSDAELEAQLGVRRTSISTQRITQADALTVANAMLARLGRNGWRVSGLVWEIAADTAFDSVRLDAVMSLLDGTSRLALPILLEDLPDWSPLANSTVPLFLEGGRYHSVDGAWVLDLHTSAALAVGQTAPWDTLPADWSWDEMDPSITWNDLYGVGI